MNYHKFGKTCFTTSVLVFTCTLIGNGFAFLQEEQYLIANKTLWIQTKNSCGSIPLPDMCSDTSNNTFEHPLQSCISYVESVSYGEVVGVYLREMFDLCQTCIRNSLTNIEASPETWQIGCDNIPTTSDIVLFSYVFSIDGLVENLESGTWIGDVCRHDNVSHIKLKDLEGCDHSSNAANILFVQHVCSIKNSTNSKDFGLALPTRLNSSHLLFEKLLKAYNCAQECDAYQFFHVTFTEQDLKCKCERGNAEPSIQIDKETGQHIYEINADPDLQGDTLNTLGEDLCVVANLKMEIRPITFTVHTTYCNESFAILCQKVTDKKIKYIFSDNETNFMESWHYCKKESAHLFLPEDFQSGALENILTFTQFTAENISVWTGVIERKTWNPLSCKMNIFSSNCSILTSSATGTDMHHQGSQTTYSTESTDLHTTTEETIEDKNKKNWFDSSRDCCLKSKILYDKEIQNDEDTFDIIQSMNAQNFSEIFLNNKVYKGPWIVPAGTYTIYNLNDSLSEVTDIYDCAILCRKCWYFGMMNNSCFNISSLFYHAAESASKHTIDLYFSKSGNILETTAPSVGVNCVQVSINTDVFPVSYMLSVKDCKELLQPLCLRANDSFYFTSQTPLNFTDSNMFCKDKGATLASSFSNQHLYSSKTANGTYWTPITRKNQQRRKDCQDETDHGGYCRKMFSNGTIVTTYCTEKTYSICIKEKEETTTTDTITTTDTTNFTMNFTMNIIINTTTTSITTRNTTPHTTTSLDLTTGSSESHVIHVDYIVKVIQDQNCIEAGFQCQQNYGSVWSCDLTDMEDTNVSQILQNKGLKETWTNYRLYFSHWIMQTGYSGGLQHNFLNLAINPVAVYECANQCVDFPNFKSLKNKCHCLLDQKNVSEYSENTTAVMYSTIKDVHIEAKELENEGRQCVVASIDFETFPMSYTFKGTACNETHHVICQNVHDNVLRYIFLPNATYHEAADRCANLSAKIFNPRDYNPGLLSKVLKSRKTETIWTDIFREFIWRKINDFQEHLEKFERPFCRVLGCNGTLESRLCSERNSALCFINKEYENFTRISTTSTLSQVGTAVHTTTEEILEDKNKKNWFDSSSDCCRKSKILYDEEIQNDDDNFNIIHEMNAQNFTEIYLNNRVFKGPWIVPAGTYTIYIPNDSLSEVTDIYDCAVLCRKCWYFGMMNNSCFNISSLFHHAAESSNKHTIDLYFSKSGDILETTAPSVGVNCVQVSTNTDMFPVSYILFVKDCEESLQPLCLRANDSFYFTSQTPLNFTDSNIFCKDKGATLASLISSRHLFNSRIANGTYWTAITRKNQLGRKDCQNETDHGGYCRKMFSNSSIVTTDCKEKTYSICIKEKEETTTTEAITTTATTNFTTNITINTTTTSTSTRTTTPHTITSLDLTTASTESHVIHVDYIVKVIQDQNCIEAAFQCQQNYGSVWSYDLPDMEDTNVSQILQNKGLEETCTNYGLFVSNWIMQTGYSGGLQSNAFNIAINPEAAYECSNQCVEFPNFKSLENECHCLLDQTNVSDYSENTTAVVYSTIKDVDIEAIELENEGKQCVVASIDFDVFPMSYTFKGTACNETHHVICQKFHDNVLRYIFLPNATYHEAADMCSNLSAKIFNPRDYDPGLLSTVLKSVKTETIWTEIFREFIWRKINGFWEHLKKFEPLFCRVLGCNGTLESQLCSERNSALCFINKEYENFTQMPTTSTISQVGTTVHTTAELTPEEMNKKNWFDWSNDCCQKSNTLYDNEIQNDKNDFDIIEEMNAQNFTEIYLNYRVFPGAWIVPAGTYTINFQNDSLSKVTDIYDCAILCRKCWYFGMMNNRCVNISSLFYNGSDGLENHTIDLYSSKEGDVLEATAPSVGVDCVQLVINTDVFPVSYLLSMKDCEESLKALCLRANDSLYFTSHTLLNFTDSKTFCNDKGATLASSFSNLHLYNSRVANGMYWTPITRKNYLRRKDCRDRASDGGYCRKMFLNGTIITTDCTEKTYSICVKEKVTTTTSTTTTTTTAAPTTTTSLALTTSSTESHVIHVDYKIKVIQNQNYSDAAVQCQQSHGSIWSNDLPDMEATNVSQMLINKGLEETWTKYELVVSNWIMQTEYGGGIQNNSLDLITNPEVAYECSNRCADFPNFISLKNDCHCLPYQKNLSDNSENTTVPVYSTIKDIKIDAEDLEYADKQCVVASINFEMFPMIYTFIGRNCNETHHVICQNVRDNVIGYTYLTNATYHQALEACSNLSATIFNPRDYNPALLSKVLKSRKTETIWIPIWREFIWQKLNDFQEYLEKFKRQLCRVLDCNGTLKTRSCSERSSALCFINKNSEHSTQIPIFSSTFSDKNSEKVTQIPNNATISQVDTSTDRRNVTTAPPTSENLLLYIGLSCGALVLVLVVVISIILRHKRRTGINKSPLHDSVTVADDVQSNINETILRRINGGVRRTEDQCEGDVLQMNGFNSGFYNSRYAEYNPENQRAIDTQRNSIEISPNTFTYGEQEGDDHGDRDEDDLNLIMFNDGNYNSERDVYSVVKKDRRTTDTDEDGGDRENSDNHPEFKFTMRYNKNTFDRRKVEERGGLSKL